MRVWITVGGILVAWLAAFLVFVSMGAEPPQTDSSVCVGGRMHCGAIVRFEPAVGRGYEVASNERYLRRDLMMRVQHAAARVADAMGGHPVTLLDMSERDGAIPGTAQGFPAHPFGSHTDGHDIDVAYYQLGTPDNHVRPVCVVDDHHCIGPPEKLDACRTALFIADLFETPGIRVVGVDGRVGPAVEACLDRLVAGGTLDRATRERVALAYEVEDTGLGWYRFRFGHMHVSVVSSVVVDRHGDHIVIVRSQGGAEAEGLGALFETPGEFD